ncbi:vacuolar protein sorting-associated protein 16 homolog isoform 2-T3 [Menidia menidia]
MVWCRRPRSQQPSVVLMWEQLLLVAGLCGDTIQFPLEERAVLVGELDGVRILSGRGQELLQEVPLVCQEIFKIASMAPGALLLEAHREYEKCSQKADEYLREIKEQQVLAEAVRQCTEAAAHEYDPPTQKALMRAASFGKCFLSDFSPEQFVGTCRELRVLNSVREPSVGMPLTHTQFKQMTLQVLIDRLVYRQFYPLAIEICRYLKIPDYQGVSRVLKHWAACKVQQKDLSDEAIARAVCIKVGDTPGVSYSHIAAKAYECGRIELAIKLLDFEARSGEQVPLLLKMKRSQLALSKAVESGDTDLVYTVVTYLKNEMNRGDFFMTLRNQPVALSLYRQFCKLQEQETLKDLYNQDDDHQELANYYVTASYREKRLESRLSQLQSAVDEYNRAKNDFAAKATEEEMRLLRFQRKLDDEKGAGLLGLSLQATMEALLSLGLQKQAEQLYRDFRVPDKRYWWLKLKSLAEKEEWEDLEKFSKSRKSPIGYLAFVEVCMKHNNRHEAKKYVSKVTAEQRVKAHLAVGDLEGAADVAIERRNDSEVGAVLSRCSAADRLLSDRLSRAQAARKGLVMSSVKVESVVAAGALIGEGPVWEESEQTLLFVDIAGQKIHRWSPATNQIQSVGTNQTVGFAVPRRSGGYVAGVGRGIVAVDWSTEKMTSLAEVEENRPNNRLNDGKVDPAGRLLAGTMEKDGAQTKNGSLYSVDSELRVTKLLGQVDISNGLDWSLDQRTMFYIDSLGLTVDAFDYDSSTGTLGARRVVYRLEQEEGLPDGMTLDADGRLWVACYDGGRVLHIDPATGVRLQTVSLPVTKTTSCCFGGPDYSDLYVTSASLGLSQWESSQQPLAGNTFRVKGLGVKGRPSCFFSG